MAVIVVMAIMLIGRGLGVFGRGVLRKDMDRRDRRVHQQPNGHRDQ